ncbi:tetratricopeptide repeat protein [Gemmatimonas sp.]|uniref:tetratricopeptide repeat protein n=1 Tax=Gemmatimonas sp. TaxID=1962908 RepID=UPI00286AF8B3|nr:tetratricopeptide repeat protein [Gemmatimonas sp.]
MNAPNLSNQPAVRLLRGEDDDTAHPLTLGLFGMPRFTGLGAPLAAELLGKPKAFALLAYLALAGSDLRGRDEILALFWPDSDTTRARNALRQSVFLLKRYLPTDALVVIGQERIGLSAARVHVDATTFALLLGQGRLREALALYRGPLLPGFTLYEGSDVTAWLSIERDRVHRQAMRGAMGLARESSANGDAAGAAALVRFAVERSPYDEALLRAGITLLSETGDRRGAVALYDEAAVRFRETLEIALSPETEEAGRALNTPLAPPAYVAPVTNTMARARSVSPEARRWHLKARAFAAQRSPLTIMKAIDGFEHAIRLSPDYAEAHAGLGFALCQAAVYVDYPGSDVWARAKAHAARASRLDPQLGEAHAVLAHVTLCYDYGWQAAESLYQKAISVDPASTVTRHSYALYFLAAANRTDEALALLDRARDETPENPGHSVYYALCCIFGRQFERAQQEAESVIEAHPTLVQAQWIRGMAREGMGDFAGAITAFEHAVWTTGRSSMYLSQLGRALACAGDHAGARRILAELHGRGSDCAAALYNSAEILAAMGEIEPALDCLYGAYRQRNPYLIFAGVKYALDPLRGAKRFRDLLTRVGVPSSAQSPAC